KFTWRHYDVVLTPQWCRSGAEETLMAFDGVRSSVANPGRAGPRPPTGLPGCGRPARFSGSQARKARFSKVSEGRVAPYIQVRRPGGAARTPAQAALSAGDRAYGFRPTPS